LSRVERNERPVGRIFGSKAFRFAGRQRDVETIEWQMQAFAASLDVAFLASPTGIEAFVTFVGREGTEFRQFVLRKKAARDVFPVIDGTNEFDVYAEASVRREREQSEAARVGDVEVDGRIAGGWSQTGFAAIGVVEFDLVRRRGEVLAEEFAEDGAGSDIGVAIAVEGEAVGARVFVGREGGFPSDRGEALRVVR